MNLETENVIRKVQKLLKLSDTQKNNFQAEADSALAMANKLMEENNLSMSDVVVKELKAEGAKDVRAEYRRNCVPWERMLGGAMGALFGCKSYRHQKADDDTWRKTWYTMSFVGVGQDAAIASAAYETLHEQILDMGRRTAYRGSEQGTYMLGIAHAIYDRCNKLAKEAAKNQKEKGVCKDLILVKDVVITEYCETKLRLRNISMVGRMSGSWSSRQHGYEHGKEVGLPSRTQIS